MASSTSSAARSRRAPRRQAPSNGRAATPRGGSRWQPEPLAAILAAAELLTSELLSGAVTSRQVKVLVGQVSRRVGLPPRAIRPSLHALVARDTRFLTCETGTAARAQLEALMLFAPVTHASVWLATAGEPVCVARIGRICSRRRLRAAARRTMAGIEPPVDKAPDVLRALPIGASAALVFESKARWVARALQFSQETAGVLVPLVDRLLPGDEVVASTRSVLDTADRRVARIGLDLHDGPLQVLALLASELITFERQLDMLVSDEACRRVAQQRLSDLAAIVDCAGKELREIAAAGGRPGLSLRDSLGQAVRQLRSRSAIEAELRIDGDVDRTTASQRIAVVRVVDEALANVVAHSRATAVRIDLRCRDGHLFLSVADNGRGFDVARTQRRAFRDQHLGLAVMSERIRLLGGRVVIDSKPGGPTAVTASLSTWHPAETAGSARPGRPAATRRPESGASA